MIAALAFVLTLAGAPAATTAPSPAPVCFREVVTNGEPATVDFPAGARNFSHTVTTLVTVNVDETGLITLLTITKSSGDAYLDGAALKAAHDTNYLPKIVNCKSVPGTYVFRADFLP